MSKVILACLLGLFITVTVFSAYSARFLKAMTREPPKTKVYLIMSYRGNDLSIEKVYLKKENAQKYCDMYKDSHNYSVEERELTE
jgi:hypothetical protein